MNPEKFKSDVQAAYTQAIRNTNSWFSYTDHTYQIFNGVVVYGREAGIDLIQSVIGAILEEAVRSAKAKRSSLELRPARRARLRLPPWSEPCAK